MAHILQFEPFQSFPDVSFWHELCKRKLEEYRLSEEAVTIGGHYSPSNTISDQTPTVAVESGSFSVPFRAPPLHMSMRGELYNSNTIEAFKALDKKELFSKVSNDIWQSIIDGSAWKEPERLNRFLLLTHSDLKKYRFHYWFAFPALAFPTPIDAQSTVNVSDRFTSDQLQCVSDQYDDIRGYRMGNSEREESELSAEMSDTLSTDVPFFLVQITESGDVRVGKLEDWDQFFTSDSAFQSTYVAVADPSRKEGCGGWPARNLLMFLAVQKAEQLRGKRLNVLFFRQGKRCVLPESFIIETVLPVDDVNVHTKPKAMGWERDAKGSLKPRYVDLNATMDPKAMAESQTTLNLKLMKWRLMPSLELDLIANTKCLLVGSGTLGCNIARALLGWGVKNITLIDNGKVSYSNPVRQSLFNFEDCFNGGKVKSVAAAEALKTIYPSVNAKGVVLTIPMPGHPVPDSMVESTKVATEQLEQLIKEHDVIFLLTDSRESRWLPAMLSSRHNKICINSALGFDTFVVMRHGCSPLVEKAPGSSEHRLGCYFCSDVVAPQDSLTNRTLDQQCTVTRPGVSMLAASMAVELMVSVLHHPHGTQAAADTDMELSDDTPTAFGIVPHQVRGFLSHFRNSLIVGHAYDKCTACSEAVVSAYQKEGFSLLLKAFNSPQYLEDLTGLTAMKEANADVSIEWEDFDDMDDF